MRRISLVAASVLALGWATAKAETVSAAGDTPASTDTVNVPAAPPATPATTPPPATSAPSTTVTVPNTTITAPPGSSTTITTPATPAPSATPGDTTAPANTSPAAPSTNIEITPPPAAPSATTPSDSGDSAGSAATDSDADHDNNAVVQTPPQQPVQPVAPVPVYENRDHWGAGTYAPRIGTALMLGGGFQDFTGTNIRNVTGSAGFWTARLVFGTRQFVGFEAAYVGSAQNINALGLSSDAVLVSNGAEGALRINIPVVRGRSLLEPFGFVGAGWSRYHVARSATNTSDVSTNDDILQIPYGAGLAFGYQGFIADARFTYRSTFYNDLLRTNGGRLDNWSVGGQMGFEF